MGRAAEPEPRDILANVDGINIVRDVHLLPGMPGHYDRACVQCKLHSNSRTGVFCHKSRTFGPRNMAMLGQREPVAFLASWITAASRFKDKEAHMKWKPGHTEVCSAMATLGSGGVEG